MPGNSSPDQEQVSVSIDTHHDEILCRATYIAHVAGHFLAFENPTR
jgi:hypothetical protein